MEQTECDGTTFLVRVGLGPYAAVFQSHGFTTIQSLMSIRHEHLTAMNVRASDQQKLKRALENYRATGQICDESAAPSQHHAFTPQMPPPAQNGQAYGKGGLWMDPNQESGAYGIGRDQPPASGLQWVDGPGTGAPPAFDPASQMAQAQHAQQAAQLHVQQQQQQAAEAAALYAQFAEKPGTQWVDSPTGPAAAAPVVQDMVFQWVDSPAPGQRIAQQHYPPAPQVNPYYTGMDPSGLGHYDPLRSPAGLGLDPLSPYGAAQGMDSSLAGLPYPGQQAFGGAHDPTGLYDPLGSYQASNPPSPQQMGGAHWNQRKDLQSQYDQQQRQGGWGNLDHDQSRARQPVNQGKNRPQQGGKGMQDQGKGGQSGGKNNSRQQQGTGADIRGGRGGANDSAPGGRTNAARTGGPDMQGAMGPEVLRPILVSALESLYEDRIKPLANYVKGRLKERSCPESLVKSFVDLYAEHPDLFYIVRPAQPDEEVAIFQVKDPAWFKGWVDIDSADDPYDDVMWAAFGKFLEGEHTFAGGRYGMARELMQRHLPFFKEHSLGEVCHIVQLAIQHRKIIVYHRKMLKPIQTVLQPSPDTAASAAGAEDGEEIKDMDDLCCVLFRMLLHHPQGLRLCRLKQMIKHEFSRKLSEMAFHCTKLIELFNQEPLTSTFVLDTENDGKSIYVRMGSPAAFTDHMKEVYALANSAELQAQGS